MLFDVRFIIFLLSMVLIYTLSEGSKMLLDSITTQDIIAGDVFFEIIDPPELQYTYRLRPAKDFGMPFNASFKINNVALVPTVPAEACSDIENYNNIIGNVALIQRGECSFLEKTIQAEMAGARAAIITEATNQVQEFDYYTEMVHDSTDREANIPAGFLLGRNGQIIRKTLKNLGLKHAIINIPVNLTFTPPHMINQPPWLGW